MNRSAAFSRTVLASTLALAGLIGCKQEEPNIAAKDYPAEVAVTYCKAVFSCQCDSYPYANLNECFSELLSGYSELNDEAYIAGLSYDGSCAPAEIEQIESLACQASLPGGTNAVCVPPCYAWHGSTAAGGLCEYVASAPEVAVAFSNCAQGLTCAAGVCVNPCQSGPVLPGIGQPCPDMVCAAGAMCDGETMMCVAQTVLPGPGEPCADGLCDPKRAVCVAEANACAALPTVGQACIQGQCDANSYCGVDNVCLGSPALACGLLGVGVPGDGDGDTTGDGDGDPTGDGDGDMTGDGDGDGGGDCTATPLPATVPVAWEGDTSSQQNSNTGSCGGAGPESALTFVAPDAGLYVVRVVEAGFDTVLYVRDGGCGGTELACNDDEEEGITTSAVSIPLDAGQEVTIFVDGYEGSGFYLLEITTL